MIDPVTDTLTDMVTDPVICKVEINVVVGIVRVGHCPVEVKLDQGPWVESGQLLILLVSIRTLIKHFQDRGPNPERDETQVIILFKKKFNRWKFASRLKKFWVCIKPKIYIAKTFLIICLLSRNAESQNVNGRLVGNLYLNFVVLSCCL